MADDIVDRLWARLPGMVAPLGLRNPDGPEAASEIESLRSLIAEAGSALKPFAEATMHLHPAHPDDGETLDGFKVADFRRARQVLSRLTEGE